MLNQISWRAKFFFDISNGQVLTHSKGVFFKETSKLNKIWGFVGQIKSLRGPHLTRGLYVAHAWSKPMTHSIERTLANVWKRLEIYLADVDKNNYKNLYGVKSCERNYRVT